MGQILHRNSQGIVIVREDFERCSQVKIINENCERPSCLYVYIFTLVHEPVKIPYCSWANLDCCGSWDYDEEYLDTAVQKGLKLFAGRATYLPDYPTVEEAIHQFETLKDSLPADVFADIETGPDNTNHDYLHTFICRTGPISEYLDLNMVFDFYEKLRVHISDAEKEEIKRLCDIEIREYGTDNAPFQYSRAVTTTQLITTGLLLGYPIESTASILQGR